MRFLWIILGWLTAPRQLLALAGMSVAAGLLWSYAAVHENAGRALALRQGPPAAVAIEDFRRAANRGPAGEVLLRAQADPERPLVLVRPRTGERALVVPLFPLGGGDGATGAIFLPLAPGQTMADPARLAHRLADRTVEVNGRMVDAGDFELMLAGALAAEGRFVAPAFVAVEPFLDGREAALQPVADPSRRWLWPVVLGLGLALAASGRSYSGARTASRLRAESGTRMTAPAAVPVSRHFAPLQLPEDGEGRGHAGGAVAVSVLRAAIAFASTAARLAARGMGTLARLVTAGVGELRSRR